MKNRYLAFLGIAVVLLFVWKMNRSDRRENHRPFPAWQMREAMEPCKTADEWLTRWEKKGPEYGSILHFLFAELPPESEWSALLARVKEQIEREDQEDQQGSPRSIAKMNRKLRFFHAVLSEDQDAIQDLSREMMKNSDWQNFGNESGMNEFLSLQKDPEEGLRWLKANGWDPNAANEARTSTSREAREDWEEQLAKGEMETALELLWKKVDAGDASAADRILKVARALDDTDLEQRALTALKVLAERYPTSPDTSYWMNELARQGRWQEIRDITKRNSTKQNGYSWGQEERDLAVSYHLDGAEAYIEAYAQKTQGKQLLQTPYFLQSSFHDIKLDAIHIEALVSLGRRDDAITVAQHLLAKNPRNDDLHRQLRALDASVYAEFLQRLHTFDPHEERPLIWQAQMALDAGDATKAKALIDQAIALDPADGDQSAGSRMLAYEVLARVLTALGDTEKAKFFQEVVLAIREGEKADEFRYAGMIQEAVKRYQAALGRFNDAYCLQSRLALTLAQEGRFEEAVPHFEKAFELMPVSFGPRESHCFGCEGLFSDTRIVPIAMRVLTEFSTRHPENPRAPYLLGLVLNSASRPAEAAQAYRRAVEIDPTYYNAAKGWFNSVANSPEKYREYRDALRALTVAAPYSKLDEAYAKRTDLAQAWRDAETIPPSPLKLLPFPKETAKSPPAENANHGYVSYSDRSNGSDGWSRAELFESNFLIRLLK